MTNGNLEDRVLGLEQRQQRQDEVLNQVNNILLVVAQRLNTITERQDRNAIQIEANTIAIAELRAAIERQFGNGQSG